MSQRIVRGIQPVLPLKTAETLFFSKNAYNLAEPEDVLILAHTFS